MEFSDFVMGIHMTNNNDDEIMRVLNVVHGEENFTKIFSPLSPLSPVVTEELTLHLFLKFIYTNFKPTRNS